MDEIDLYLPYQREATNMILFTRWLAMNYEGILNIQNEEWYLEKLKYYKDIILPMYIENGTYLNTIKNNKMKEYNVSFETTILSENAIGAAKEVDEILKRDNIRWVYTVQQLDEDKIVCVDLERDFVEEEDITNEYQPEIIGNNLYTSAQMLDFAWNFYYDLSRKNNVPENLISENFTLVEEYFKETFKK